MFNVRIRKACLQVTTVISALSFSICPFLAFLILHWSIYNHIKARNLKLLYSAGRGKSDNYLVTILSLIVILFGVCHTPKCLLNIFELVTIVSGNNTCNAEFTFSSELTKLVL